MTLYREFPDVEAIAATKLRTAAIPGVKSVSSSVPKDADYPLITVQRVGGVPAVREYMDAANIQIGVWGENKSQARDIAARARVVLLELTGTAVTDPVSAWVSSVDDSLSLTWSPDPETGKDRYIFSMMIHARS